MLGKDSKKNIQFPVQKQGTPSVVVLEAVSYTHLTLPTKRSV